MTTVATDTFASEPESLSSPYEHAAVISPDNSNDLAKATRAVWVGSVGDLKVDMVGGETGVTFTAVPTATLLQIRVKRVYSTGTSASALVALW